jgi:hypothetical protein
MRLMTRVLCLSAALALFTAATAGAQQYTMYKPKANPAIGETYHVEFGIGLWDPSPAISVSADALAITGNTTIDAVTDLGIEKTNFKDFRLVIRPFKKHKFRMSYLPIEYKATATLQRTIIFQGVAYQIGVPVESDLRWNAWRFGYEYDFLYRDRGFIGFIVDAKYTDISVSLKSPFYASTSQATAPIPAIGGIFRLYPVKNVAITGELTAFKLPTGVDPLERYDGTYVDYDISGTLNFTNNVGVQTGYRSLTVDYRVRTDTGHVQLRGWYFLAVARF